MDTDEIHLSLPFYRLNSPGSLSLSSQDRCSCPSITLMGARDRILSAMSMSFLYWGALNKRGGHTVASSLRQTLLQQRVAQHTHVWEVTVQNVRALGSKQPCPNTSWGG